MSGPSRSPNPVVTPVEETNPKDPFPRIEVSVVIPLKDEAENIIPLAQEIEAAFDPSGLTWECIWVDDGSIDQTSSLLKSLAARNPRHRFLSFESNAGQSAALWAGFREAGGEIIASIDGDGQNDPADLPRLVEMVREGRADMVNGRRAKRFDGPVRKISSKVANSFRNLVTGRTVSDVGCSTRAFRRECADNLPRFKGMHRFLPTLAAMEGYSLAEVPVGHRPRLKGRSKYGVNNRLWVGLVDTLAILWLRKRFFNFRVIQKSDPVGKGDDA
jgi:dolichol-phosphate mannosyltransferase